MRYKDCSTSQRWISIKWDSRRQRPWSWPETWHLGSKHILNRMSYLIECFSLSWCNQNGPRFVGAILSYSSVVFLCVPFLTSLSCRKRCVYILNNKFNLHSGCHFFRVWEGLETWKLQVSSNCHHLYIVFLFTWKTHNISTNILPKNTSETVTQIHAVNCTISYWGNCSRWRNCAQGIV